MKQITRKTYYKMMNRLMTWKERNVAHYKIQFM